MRAFTLVEVLIVMVVLAIIFTIAGVVMNSVYRHSILAFDRTTLLEELARIDAAIKRELLKAGPRIEDLEVNATSVEFETIVPFSRDFYGVYRSSTELIYKLSFERRNPEEGELRLHILTKPDKNPVKSIVLGVLNECEFKQYKSDQESQNGKNIVRYTLTKKHGANEVKLESSVVLYKLQ